MRPRPGPAVALAAALTAGVTMSGCGWQTSGSGATEADGRREPVARLTCRATTDGILDYVAGATGVPDPLDAAREAHVDEATRYEELPHHGPAQRVFTAYDASGDAIALIWVARADGPSWLLVRTQRCE